MHGDFECMGEIREEIEITGIRKSKKIVALFDSGAERNYIRKILEDGNRVDEDIGFHIYGGIHRTILANTDEILGEKVKFKKIHIKERSFEDPEFIVMEKLFVDAIIGSKLMQKLGIILDLPNKRNNYKPVRYGDVRYCQVRYGDVM